MLFYPVTITQTRDKILGMPCAKLDSTDYKIIGLPALGFTKNTYFYIKIIKHLARPSERIILFLYPNSFIISTSRILTLIKTARK